MKKTYGYRIAFYLLGLLVLALGITLNTKVGLGVSPIISVSYSISTVGGFNFGNTTFVQYSIFVVIEMILHSITHMRHKNDAAPSADPASRRSLKLTLLFDLLQLPLSLIFTRFMNLFSAVLPNFATDDVGAFAGSMPGRILILCVAIALTGIGAALSLNMRIIPNPGDGIVQAIADCIGKSVGFTKNCFDLLNITITAVVSMTLAGHLIGIGIGTVLAVIGVGRVIAVFNHFCYKPTMRLSGLEAQG